MQTSPEKSATARDVRIAVVTIHESWSDERATYRLCETDGTVCDCWLPGLELPEPLPLDRGGFESRSDAQGFKLGIDRERALFGLLPGLTVEDIDRERHQLDTYHGKHPATLDDFAPAQPERLPPFVRCRPRVA